MKERAGTLRADRANPNEPTPAPAKPRRPAGLNADEANAWRELLRLLDPLDVTTPSDAIALEMAARVLVEWRELCAEVRKYGRTYATETKWGSLIVKARPEVAMSQDAYRRLGAQLARFGLSPADRSRVSAQSNDEPLDSGDSWASEHAA